MAGPRCANCKPDKCLKGEPATEAHEPTELIFLLHVATTWFMVGLIWFVQIVHYPLLGDISKYRVAAYEQTHMRLTTWVVGPPMFVEMATGIFLIFECPAYFDFAASLFGLICLVLVWLSTAFLQAPQHQVLATGYDEHSHRFLIRSNWIRTLLWSVRGLLLLQAAMRSVHLQ